MRAAGACIVLLLGMLLSPVFGADVLGYPFCDALRDSDSRAACLAYINAASSIGKWTSAVRWARFYRGSYQCANVTALCLLNDMHAERYGSTCTVAASNSRCEMDAGGSGTCWNGACVGAAEAAVNMLLAKDGLKPDTQQQLQQPWQQWQALQQQQQPPAQLALLQGSQQQPYMQWPQQHAGMQVQGSPLQLPQIPQLPQLRATTHQMPPAQLQAQAQVQAAAAPAWQPSNMRLAAKQQQQRRWRPKQQHTRASLMQAAAPQPPADSSAAAGDNYEYDELNRPAAAAPPPAAAGDSSAQDADGATDADQVDDGNGDIDTGFDPAEGDEQLQPGAGPGAGLGSGKLGEFQLDPNDPYGLDIDFGKNSKINDPFAPPAPPAPPQPPVPKPPPPEPTKGQLTLDIVPDAFVQAVPPSFVGVSREWTPFVWYDQNMDAFERIFAQLGPSPILRIGGATQEALIKLPDAAFMNALVKLHCRFGVRYIIGLPLFQNAPQLPQSFKALFDAVFRDYPFAIVNYELGNEPNYWPTKAGGFTQLNGATTCTSVQQNQPAYQLVGTYETPADRQTDGFALYRDTQEPYTPYKPQSYCFTPQTTVFAPGLENYNIYFKRAAEALTGCGGLTQETQAAWGWPYWGAPGFNRRVLSGPSWADFATDINQFKTFLQNSNQCYLNEATFHYYGPNRNATFDQLFNKLTGIQPNVQPPRPLISIVKDFIREARLSNITLRISEANSIPDGGQGGFSNTIGAAIWTLVTAMEFAQAGASGINFHWGDGGSPTSLDGGVPVAPAYVGLQLGFRNDSAGPGRMGTPYPIVRVPFYGYVMFSRAFGNNGPGIFLNYSSDAVVSQCRDLFFTYAILVPHAGMISVVAANANSNLTCDVTAALPGVSTTGATLQLLTGPKGNMSAFEGISLAGQTYQGTEDGSLKGTFKPEVIQPHMHNIRTTGWTFTIPPASAALLQIPLVGGANQGLGSPTQTPNLVDGGTQEAVDPLSAAWSEPLAVPFPPNPNFPAPGEQQQQDSSEDEYVDDADGKPAADGGDAAAAGDGDGGAGEDAGQEPAAAGGSGMPRLQPVNGAGGGGGGGGQGTSTLFERDSSTLQGAKRKVQVPALAAQPQPTQQSAAGQQQFVLKGFTPEGRPVYIRQSGTGGRAYNQQPPASQQHLQQQQQQQQRQQQQQGVTRPSSVSVAQQPARPQHLQQQGAMKQAATTGQQHYRQAQMLLQQQQQQSGDWTATVSGARSRILLGWLPNLLRRGSKRSSSNGVGVAGSDMLLPGISAWAALADAGGSDALQYAGMAPAGMAAAGMQQQMAGWPNIAAMPQQQQQQQQHQVVDWPSTAAVSPPQQVSGWLNSAAGGQQQQQQQQQQQVAGWPSSAGQDAAAAGLVFEAGTIGSVPTHATVRSTAPSIGGAGVSQPVNSGGGSGSGGGFVVGGSGAAVGGAAGAPRQGTGVGAGAAGSVGASVDISIPNPLAGLRSNVVAPRPQFLNPNLNFVPPETQGVSPNSRPVPQRAGAEFQPNGPSGVGLVWPLAGGVRSNTPAPASVLTVGVPGLGGYQLLPPGYDEAAVKRAAQMCPGIQRILDIQQQAGVLS